MSRGVILGVAISVVLGAGAGVARLLSTGELALATSEPALPEPQESERPVGVRELSSLAARQREMAQAAASRPALTSAAELASYLAALREQAQRNGRVSALEIAPGLSAIDQLIARKVVPPRARAQFLADMQQLSAQLDGRSAGREPGVEQLAERIAASEDAAERTRLTQDYVAQVALEPPERRASLLARLRALHDGADSD
jgi:hypothetical protein